MIYTNPEINPYLKLPLRACINPKTLSRREGGGGGGGTKGNNLSARNPTNYTLNLFYKTTMLFS